MKITLKNAFSKGEFVYREDGLLSEPVELTSLTRLKRFLDVVHVKQCLLRPFFEQADYPLVESRELLPSFEADLWEYKQLPGFSIVAFERPVNYFQEVFQFDILHPVLDTASVADGASCPLESQVIARNVQAMQTRLPKAFQESFRQRFGRFDTSVLDYYPALMPFLLAMDRAQVFALDSFGHFHLGGVYASFPSDLDSEIKRFGMRIGKFEVGDNEMYERNRLFVYQYLMELYGFPIVSERRTSGALFARRLHKMGERFMIRVLGQSDRTITTMMGEGDSRPYPRVEKLALVRVDADQEEALRAIDEAGYFLDRERRVVILRVTYRQHKFNPDNVRQDRALSVESQEVIHPVTGQVLGDLNIIKDATNMFLRLNDITRGEYTGRIIYKRNEIVENTDTDEKIQLHPAGPQGALPRGHPGPRVPGRAHRLPAHAGRGGAAAARAEVRDRQLFRHAGFQRHRHRRKHAERPLPAAHLHRKARRRTDPRGPGDQAQLRQAGGAGGRVPGHPAHPQDRRVARRRATALPAMAPAGCRKSLLALFLSRAARRTRISAPDARPPCPGAARLHTT